MPGSDTQTPIIYDEPQGQEFDLLRWIQLFWDNRWWIIGVTCACVIVAALYSFLSTPVYSATAIVYVQSSNRTPLGMENPGAANSWIDQQKFYDSQPDVIKSQAVMEVAARQLELAKNPDFKGMKDPWRALQGMVSVQPVRDSALFKITVTGPYKNEVADWANAVASAYREETLTSSLDYISKANKVMLDEARKMQEQYIAQQTRITKSLQKQGTYFPQNQKEILDKQIAALNDQLTDVSVKESKVAAVVAQMKRWERDGGDPLSIPAVADDPNVQDLAKQYNEMSRDLAKLEVQFTPKHPEVQKKKAEMKDLKARIADQAKIVLGTYENQLAALQTEKSNLQDQLNAVKTQGLQFVEGASRGQALTTAGQAIKKYMDLLYDKMKELNVSAALLSSNIRIQDPALPPGGPIKPKKTMNILLGFMLGLMLSAGSVVGYQYIDTTIKTVDDVEGRLGMNMLTMIPTMEKETERASVEAFQTLRTALVYASENMQKNLILMTSSAPKEGKTTVSVNLAKTLAATGDRVLLIDCDLRRSSVARYLNIAGGKKGLTHFLAERSSRIEDYIVQGSHPNLFVLTAGPMPPNPPELFSMKRFREMLEQVRKEYDWVMLDSPPYLTITDAQILGGMVDFAVVVARFKKTHRPMLERTMVMMRRQNLPIAGAVLNDIQPRSAQYYDYYYYNHYYYETGTEPKRLPWMVGRVGDWKDIFRKKKTPKAS